MPCDWSDAVNVLCVRLDAMGDVLMTTPALRALKETRPGRHITLLTSRQGAVVAPLIPEIDEVIVYDTPWMKATAARNDSSLDWNMIQDLRARRFDGAVIFTVYSQNPLPAAFSCFLADIPRRLAYCRENPYQLLTDWISDPEPHRLVRHEVRRQLDLVAAVGCRTDDERLRARVPRPAERRVQRLLHERGLGDESRWIVMHPGASAPSRRYPYEHFASAARSLATDHGWEIVWTGSADERQLVHDIQGMMQAPSHVLAGELDLAELTALIARTPLLISNNTGPAHLAAAVGTPVVDLYALTNPQHTPWMTPSRVLFNDVPCKYCYKSICPEGHHDCLRLVPPARVVDAALELLNGLTTSPAETLPARDGILGEQLCTH